MFYYLFFLLLVFSFQNLKPVICRNHTSFFSLSCVLLKTLSLIHVIHLVVVTVVKYFQALKVKINSRHIPRSRFLFLLN